MTARLRYGTVIAAEAGRATVELDGAHIDINVTSGQSLDVDEQAVIVQDGRRLVGLGIRGGVSRSIAPLEDPPYAPSAAIYTDCADYDPVTNTATAATVVVPYSEYDTIAVLRGSPVSPPSWFNSSQGYYRGVAQSNGSLTVTGSFVAVAVFTGCNRYLGVLSTGSSQSEQSAPTVGWTIDATGVSLSYVPIGSMCVGYGYAWASTNKQYYDKPIAWGTLDANAAFISGGGSIGLGTWPDNTDRFFITGGAVWQHTASTPQNLGTWEWRGPSGYLNVTDAEAGIAVAWCNPLEHHG